MSANSDPGDDEAGVARVGAVGQAGAAAGEQEHAGAGQGDPEEVEKAA